MHSYILTFLDPLALYVPRSSHHLLAIPRYRTEFVKRVTVSSLQLPLSGTLSVLKSDPLLNYTFLQTPPTIIFIEPCLSRLFIFPPQILPALPSHSDSWFNSATVEHQTLLLLSLLLLLSSTGKRFKMSGRECIGVLNYRQASATFARCHYTYCNH